MLFLILSKFLMTFCAMAFPYPVISFLFKIRVVFEEVLYLKLQINGLGPVGMGGSLSQLGALQQLIWAVKRTKETHPWTHSHSIY